MPDHVDDVDLFQDVPREERPRRRLRDRWVLVTALSLIGVLVLGGLTAALVLRNNLDRNVERIADPFESLPTRPPVASAEPGAASDRTPMNILVVGTDSRISAGDPSQWERGGQRTDVMMLVHLPADRESAYAMSIPRDSWVDIPGHGQAKMNAAFSYGGPSLLIQTFEQLTNVRIDHFAVTDFESFTSITDSLGGVQLTLKNDLLARDRRTVLVPAGIQTLDGEQALTYVRERKTLARGDFDRVQRQQAWMRAIFQKVLSEQTVQNPTRWVPFLDAVTSSVAVDEGLTMDVMQDLIGQVRNLRSADIGFFTVPIQGTGTSADGQSIVILDQPAFDDLMAAVAQDDLGTFLEQNPDAVDSLPSVAP
ncbi:LCP family protein [Actinotalea sp. K2]|uniref:LCP family protein n=1 Tax=Actinotalea sp. K2 TaxID=2939438 RepID=UPI0020171BF2|nr:LCP family protein [Actinotalea sp. K2]MCL3862909.1 LCP family protein [Actinotalea sp. K2]